MCFDACMVSQARSELRDGMRVDWDAPIEMSDGIVLRADVFRPDGDGRYPAILTHGPYAKGLSFQVGSPPQWKSLEDSYPDAVAGSTNAYQVWETVDPEKWVPDGYVCVRVDSRGAGRSPGYLNPFSALETQDYYECIEWAATQPWCNGKVGLCGISYYAMNQWQVAGLQPPHLAAIIPWEGASDFYREFTGHGGIPGTFLELWVPPMIQAIQHGVGEAGGTSSLTGELIAGPDTLSDEERAANRYDLAGAQRANPLDGEFYRERSADFSKIEIPFLSSSNWSHPLHTRGNFEAYTESASKQKWLEVHGYEHWVEFYTDYGVRLQKRFLGHFLKGEDTGWAEQPPVHLRVRHVDGTFVDRAEQEWPLARTEWTKLYLDAERGTLERDPVADAGSVSFEALEEGVTFIGAALEQQTELTGPSAAKLFVSSSTVDADLFVVLRILDLDGNDVTFLSAVGDPNGLIANGWLRASQRKLDPAKSLPHRPWHAHDETQRLTPGKPVEVEVEIWPTSVIVPAGYRVALSVWGKDFELPGDGPWPEVWGQQLRGNGMILHNGPRPQGIYDGITTVSTGGDEQSYLLLPVVPPTTN
jgi:predicted acyl esterase